MVQDLLVERETPQGTHDTVALWESRAGAGGLREERTEEGGGGGGGGGEGGKGGGVIMRREMKSSRDG